MSMADYGYPGCGDDDYDDTDIHGGVNGYDDASMGSTIKVVK